VIVPPDPQFDMLYESLFPRLAAELYAYLGDRGEAEDLAQEALLRAWQRWDLIRQYEDPVNWCRRVAWNLAISRWRRVTTALRALRRHGPPDPADGLGPDHVALVTALRTLPNRHRQAIVLHYIADLPVGQVALDLAVPKNTVLSWLRRGRTQLARQLRDQEQPSPDSLEVNDRG
jgi:RNA polymerase sigma-70 factor, ECF subfamily